MRAPFILAVFGLLCVPAALDAHARLLSSVPAAGAVVAPTANLGLHFSEALIGKLSSAELTMRGATGKAMGSTKQPARVTLGSDGKSLALRLPKPLAAGSYRIDYHVTSRDTHRVSGGLDFRVR